MASVFKRKSDKGKKHSKWIISWYDHERRKWRSRTGYTDKEASEALGARLEAESADRAEGLTSNVREESLKPIEGHLADYLTHVTAKKRDANYLRQLERRIRRVLAAIHAARLVDIEPSKVEQALLKFTCTRGFEGGERLISDTTRNEYATAIKGFTNFCTKRHRIDHDPLAGLAKVDEKAVEQVHPRRALTAEDMAALLDAAVRRPMTEVLLVRRGANKGKPLAKVRPSVFERERLRGIHRRMAYLLLVWTGLRRSEVRALLWTDVHLDVQVPYIQLRKEVTKAKRADVIPLHWQLAEELVAFRPEAAKPNEPVLPEVPSMKVLKADLAFAGIAYGDKKIGFADLHAQRKTLNTLLATHGVTGRTRQSHLRHTDPRLTENVYFDASIYLKPHADELAQVPAIPCGPSSVTATANSVTCDEDGAELMHKTCGPEGQNGAHQGTVTEGVVVQEGEEEGQPQVTQLAQDGTNEQGSTPCGIEPSEKRVKGVEPSTFTLAT